MFLPSGTSDSSKETAQDGFDALMDTFERHRFALRASVKTESWPLRIPLSSGRFCEIKPAVDSTYPHTHFVVIFPAEQGQSSMKESLEMFSLTMLLSRELSALRFGIEECYSISKNGTHTGSVPDIEHYHVYLFRDRDEKIETYARNVIPAYERLQERKKKAA